MTTPDNKKTHSTYDSAGPYSVVRPYKSIAGYSAIRSLREQLRQLLEERKNPRPKLKLSVQEDPSALHNLVDVPSPLASLIGQTRALIDDRLHPKERFQSSAAPVEVESLWSDQKRGKFGAISLAGHVAVVLLMIVPWSTFLSGTDGLQYTETFVPLIAPPPLILNMPEEDDLSGGGGGGGMEEETPPSLAELPRAAEEQFVPPIQEPLNPDPILVAEPTVVAPQLASLDRVIDLALLGSPDGIPGPPSAGPGVGGGIGTGQGRGVGEGQGPGVGEGQGGGFGGGVFRIGGGVTPPTILSRVEPQYSEEARKARYQGTVVLEAIVRRDGTVEILRVIRSLGFGLDQNAIEALRQWTFRPGMRNGDPVDVALNIEVNFNLR